MVPNFFTEEFFVGAVLAVLIGAVLGFLYSWLI
jgi:hypothetical protein